MNYVLGGIIMILATGIVVQTRKSQSCTRNMTKWNKLKKIIQFCVNIVIFSFTIDISAIRLPRGWIGVIQTHIEQDAGF